MFIKNYFLSIEYISHTISYTIYETREAIPALTQF